MCSSPKPPDPVATAQAQYQYNSQAAKDAAALNAVDQYGPFGSTTYQRNPDGTPASQTVNLSPQVQDWLNSQFGASTALQNATQTQLGFLPTDQFKLPTDKTANDYSTSAFGASILNPEGFDTSNIAQTSYDQGKSLIQPDIDAARKQMEIQLAQRGIHPGDEIWNDEMTRLDTNANNAYAGLSRQAQLDATNQQTARVNNATTALNYGNNAYQTNVSNELLERNQPFSEAAALMGTTPQFQTPSFQQTSAQGIAAPDYSGLVQSNYAQQLAQNQGIWNTVGQIGGAVAGPAAKAIAGSSIWSDENLKEDRSPADGDAILAMFRDMPVDDYRYKDEARDAFSLPEHRTGAMAQDWAEKFGGDGHTIDVGDAIGKLMAAMKSLDRRTRGMEARA